jgi:hypothetical protein
MKNADGAMIGCRWTFPRTEWRARAGAGRATPAAAGTISLIAA